MKKSTEILTNAYINACNKLYEGRTPRTGEPLDPNVEVTLETMDTYTMDVGFLFKEILKYLDTLE